MNWFLYNGDFRHESVKGYIPNKTRYPHIRNTAKHKQRMRKVFLIEGFSRSIDRSREREREREKKRLQFFENSYLHQFQAPQEVRSTKAIFLIQR